MAEGGAWQSGVFDNGTDFQKGSAPTPGAPDGLKAPGVPTAMYNPPAGAGKDGAHMPIISLALRCACIVFSLIGFALIGSNQINIDTTVPDYTLDGTTFTYSVMLKAINNSSLAYLLSVDVIVCVYSIVQVILFIVNSCTGKAVLSGPTTPKSTITVVCDTVLTYMLMAGCGAGAGTTKVDAGVSCGSLQVYCDKNSASVAMSFLAFVCIALSCAMAYFRLYRIAKI